MRKTMSTFLSDFSHVVIYGHFIYHLMDLNELKSKLLKLALRNFPIMKLKRSPPISFAIHGGKLQVVVSNRCDLIRARSLSITRSITSTPTTLGFNGFGYFWSAALTTLSHEWLNTCSDDQIFILLFDSLCLCLLM